MKNGYLLICPQEMKEDVLTHHTKLWNRKYKSLEEVKELLTFSYEKEAIYEVMKQEHVHYDVAMMYLEKLSDLSFIDQNNPKRQILDRIKKTLTDKHLLKTTPLFLSYLKETTVFLYGYSHPTREEKRIIDLLKQYTTVESQSSPTPNHVPTFVKWRTIEQEVTYVAIQIRKLLKNRVPIDHIKLLDLKEPYYPTVKRIFHWFHIPLTLPEDKTVMSLPLGKECFEKIKAGTDPKTLESFYQAKWHDLRPVEKICYKTITDILNNCPFPWDEIGISCLEQEFRRTKLPVKLQKNTVEVVPLSDHHDFYYFLLGFHQENYPIITKNEDYWSDSEKQKYGLTTSQEQNQIAKEKLRDNLFSKKHLIVTCALESPFASFYPSGLVDEWNFTVQEDTLDFLPYSHLYNQILLAKSKDEFQKYNIVTPHKQLLESVYPAIPYRTYQNAFTGLSHDYLRLAKLEELSLSYTKIDTYFRCGFRYYLSYLLKVTPEEDTFPLFLGNLFHHILRKSFTPSFSFDEEWDQYLKTRPLSPKEQFFLSKRKRDLEFIITVIREQLTLTTLKDALYEEKITVKKQGTIPVTFTGIIDKILYQIEKDTTYLTIVDYKTGTPNTNLNNIPYGIGMQLPIYLFLATHCDKFSDIKILGFYLQKILNREIAADPTKDYEQEKKSLLRLEGYSINQPDLLKKVDSTYQNSILIKGLRIGQNGFYPYSKVLSDEKIQQLISLAETKIEEAGTNILKGEFSIRPIKIGKENLGCLYCPFQELCFRKERDIKEVPEYRDLSFLGGEEHAELDQRTTKCD